MTGSSALFVAPASFSFAFRIETDADLVDDLCGYARVTASQYPRGPLVQQKTKQKDQKGSFQADFFVKLLTRSNAYHILPGTRLRDAQAGTIKRKAPHSFSMKSLPMSGGWTPEIYRKNPCAPLICKQNRNG